MLPIIISAIESPEDRDLMTDFYLEQNARMYAEAWKYLSVAEDVEDIVYEALAKIIDKMETFRDLQPKQRIPYALTTVRNLCYILLKRNSLYTMVSFDSMDFAFSIDYEASPEFTIEKKLLIENIRQVWSELKLEDRMLLEQKYILRWSDAELAANLGIQPQSVRMRLTRAKRSVMKEIQKRGFDMADWE